MQRKMVKGIRRISGDGERVYNLNVATNHNYFADGVLVHNCDDPNDAKHSRSKSKLEDTTFWWDKVMSTRGNNAKTVVKIIIQQRIAEGDLTGHVLAQGGYDHLNIPMQYEEETAKVTSIGWEDPRTEEGELAWPERFGVEEVDELKKRLGADGTAGQLQQRPSPAGGAIFKRVWINYYKEPPREFHHKMLSVDCAFKDSENSDFVAMHVYGVVGARKYLLHRVKKKLGFPETLAEIVAIHQLFPDLRYTLVEDKANGPAVIRTLKNKIRGLVSFNPNGDSKEGRAASIAPQIEAGDLWLPDPNYEPNRRKMHGVELPDGISAFVEELVTFPKGAHDDECFVAGTKIATIMGLKNIELITKKDILITPLGFARCTHKAEITGIRRVISNVGLSGTPDHKVYNKSSNKFTPLDSLNRHDVSKLTWKKLIHWASLNILFLMEYGTVCSEREDITYLKRKTVDGLKTYMLIFGRNITIVKFPMVMWYTILILTVLIMQVLILNVLSTASTLKSIQRSIGVKVLTLARSTSNILKKSDHYLSHGIHQKREENYTAQTLRKYLKKCVITQSLKHVCTVVKNFLLHETSQNTAQGHTGRCITNKTIRSPEIAWSVVRNLKQRKSQPTKSKSVAQEVVATNQEVYKTVYNLTSSNGVYYANNVLVSNCDAMVQAFIKEETASGWLSELMEEEKDNRTPQEIANAELASQMGWNTGDIDSQSEEYEMLRNGITPEDYT